MNYDQANELNPSDEERRLLEATRALMLGITGAISGIRPHFLDKHQLGGQLTNVAILAALKLNTACASKIVNHESFDDIDDQHILEMLRELVRESEENSGG